MKKENNGPVLFKSIRGNKRTGLDWSHKEKKSVYPRIKKKKKIFGVIIES